MSAPAPAPAHPIAQIEDAHRDARTRAAVLVTYFKALTNTSRNLEMDAAFGFEHIARDIIKALDTMLAAAYALQKTQRNTENDGAR